MINVLFAAGEDNWRDYETLMRDGFANADLPVTLSQSIPPDDVDYIIYAPGAALQDFTPYTRCKAVLNLWAGVEKIVGNQTLTQPLCRMVDPGLTQSMIEWVTGHVLRYHLDIDASIRNQSGTWAPYIPPVAQKRKVTVLGLGALGTVCAKALAQIGFDVTGWARSAKDVPEITCQSGPDGLTEALRNAEILVLLLPDTAETTNIIDTEALALMPEGARILNPGRGPLIDDDALLAALDTGKVAHATLDVFRIEPLPADHPYWAHPNVTVTPHIAAATRPSTAARVIADNIIGHENGAPLLNVVDRQRGY